MIKRIIEELKGAGMLLFIYLLIPILLALLAAPTGVSF